MLPKTVAGFFLVAGTLLLFLSLFVNQGKVEFGPVKFPRVNAKTIKSLKIWGALFSSSGIIMYLLGYGTILLDPFEITLTPSPTPSLTLALTPTQSPLPTLTITPSQIPSLTPTFTPIAPSPSPTCPANIPDTRQFHEKQHAQFEEVHYKINGGPVIQVSFGDTITLNHADLLELTQIKYVAPANRTPLDNLTLEAYYQFGDCMDFYYEDGRYSTGALVKGTTIPLPIPDPVLGNGGIFNPGWNIGRGWKQVLIVLVHNYPGCGNLGCVAIEDKFRFSVIVK